MYLEASNLPYDVAVDIIEWFDGTRLSSWSPEVLAARRCDLFDLVLAGRPACDTGPGLAEPRLLEDSGWAGVSGGVLRLMLRGRGEGVLRRESWLDCCDTGLNMGTCR